MRKEIACKSMAQEGCLCNQADLGLRLNSPVTWDKSEPQLPICEMGTETLLTCPWAAGKTEIRQEKPCKQYQVHRAFCDGHQI